MKIADSRKKRWQVRHFSPSFVKIVLLKKLLPTDSLHLRPETARIKALAGDLERFSRYATDESGPVLDFQTLRLIEKWFRLFACHT